MINEFINRLNQAVNYVQEGSYQIKNMIPDMRHAIQSGNSDAALHMLFQLEQLNSENRRVLSMITNS